MNRYKNVTVLYNAIKDYYENNKSEIYYDKKGAKMFCFVFKDKLSDNEWIMQSNQYRRSINKYINGTEIKTVQGTLDSLLLNTMCNYPMDKVIEFRNSENWIKTEEKLKLLELLT